MDPKILSNLKAENYLHPFETKALERLMKTKGLKKIVNKFQEIGIEQNMKLQYRSSSVQVSNRNFSHLQYLAEKASDILQVDISPEIYIQRSDRLEGFSLGHDSPMIILSSLAVDSLTNQELLFLLGREIGHLDHEHTLYKEIGLIFPDLMEAFSVVTLGLTSLVSSGVKYALHNWDLASEYTADRGGMLACQDEETALSFFAKLAGWPEKQWTSINLSEFKQQVISYEPGSNKAFDKIINYMLGGNSWAIARAKEIVDWMDEGVYEDLVGKNSN